MAGTQSHPVEYPGFPIGRATCSMPVKGSNRGCPAFNACVEKSKGSHPVNIFAVDSMGKGVVVNHCEQWYTQLRVMVDANSRPRFTRIDRPETMRVKIAKRQKDGSSKTEILTVKSPPLELRGETGSGCHAGEDTRFDMLGPEVRAAIGESLPDDTEAAGVEITLEALSGVAGPPQTVEHVSSASGAQARAAAQG